MIVTGRKPLAILGIHSSIYPDFKGQGWLSDYRGMH
jgi:hypothetical protein